MGYVVSRDFSVKTGWGWWFRNRRETNFERGTHFLFRNNRLASLATLGVNIRCNQLRFAVMASSTVTLSKPKRTIANRRNKDAAKLIRHKMKLIEQSVKIEDLPNADPSETMQLLINRVTFLWRAAAAEVNRLKPGIASGQNNAIEYELWVSYDEQGNAITNPNVWVELEGRYARELGKLTEAAQKLGLSDRMARVAEGQLQIIGEALQNAAMTAGLTAEQRRILGAALRTELTTIEARRPSLNTDPLALNA